MLEDGVVYHTYSTYARGLDGLWGMYQWLDRAPKGHKRGGRLVVAPPRRIRQALSQVVALIRATADSRSDDSQAVRDQRCIELCQQPVGTRGL